MDGKVKTGAEKEYCSILTSEEEGDIVRHIMNNNHCLQGLNRKQISELIIKTLTVRKRLCQKENWRRVRKLSKNTKSVLATNKLGKSFWTRFDAKYSKCIPKKRQGNVSINRALNCTRNMAESHLDELAKELITCGIFTDAVQQKAGIWTGVIDTSRIFNHDENHSS